MKKIKIVTDSCFDLPDYLVKEHNIEFLPLLINFEEKSYLDRVEITFEQMQERINLGGNLPTTAQVTPMRFEEYFRKNLEEGYTVLAILMSSNMSGTYNSACIAKDMLESDDIVIVDSQVVTSAEGYLVLKACELRDKGLSALEIKEELDKIKHRIKASLCFESLDNLVRGGRISKTVGTIGSALGLKIIVGFKDGQMGVIDKLRGNKKVLKKIIGDYEEGNPDPNEPVILIEAVNPELKSEIKAYFDEKNIRYIETEVGCTVGIHSGERAAGIFFISKE